MSAQSSPLLSAPPIPQTAPQATAESADVAAVSALKNEVNKGSLPPAQALKHYGEFAQSHPALNARAGLLLSDAIAQVQLNGLRDSAAALATYEAALATYRDTPQSLGTLTEQAKILLALGRPKEAQERIERHLTQLLSAPPVVSSPVLRQLARSLTQQGQKAELVALLQGVLTGVPAFLEDGVQSRPQSGQSLDAFLLDGVKWGWMYDTLVTTLLEQGQTDAALSWAKARYVTAPASSAALDRATRMLARAAMAKDPSGHLAIALVRARVPENQETDPLATVPLPAVVPLGDKAPAPSASNDLNSLLIKGDWNGAMSLACHVMAEESTSLQGALEVASVFKAADLNTGRANAWLAFARSGEGANPLGDFFRQQLPPEALAATRRAGHIAPLQTVAPLEELASLVPLKIALLRSKALLLEPTFESGGITTDEIAYVLRWGGIVDGEGQTDNKKLRVALAGLLVKSAPALTEPASDNQNLRMAVADYLREQKDARSETMLRALLAEGRADAPGNGGQRAWYYEPSLNRLAEFYRATGETAKAQALYVQEERDSAQGDAIASSVAALEAARLSTLLGDEGSAQTYYARVLAGTYGWTAGLALWDQANALIEKGQHDKARQLLQQPLSGRGADQARVGLLSLLALSYYRTGDIDLARQTAQAAISQAKASDVRDGRGLLEQAQYARELIQQLDEWRKRPLQLDPGEVRLALRDLNGMSTVAPATKAATPKQADAPVTRRIIVRTLTAEPLQISSDNPSVKVRLLEEVTQERLAVKRTLEITFSSSKTPAGLRASVLLQSARHPEYATTLPIIVADK